MTQEKCNIKIKTTLPRLADMASLGSKSVMLY